MPSPKEVFDSVVRALEAETEPDTTPTTPEGANARLSAFATINPDLHDAGGYNRDHPFPGIDVTLDRKNRLDDGGPAGEWSGEYERDDTGDVIGRILTKRYRIRLELAVVMYAGDTDHTLIGLDDDLESVLNRFDTDVRGDFLVDAGGVALQDIKEVADDGGNMARGGSGYREYDHYLEIEFIHRISEADEYGPTPVAKRVLVPRPDEHGTWEENPALAAIEGEVSPERIEAEGGLEAIATGDTLSIASGESVTVYGTFDHDGTVTHDGTVEFDDEP